MPEDEVDTPTHQAVYMVARVLSDVLIALIDSDVIDADDVNVNLKLSGDSKIQVTLDSFLSSAETFLEEYREEMKMSQRKLILKSVTELT